jgi:hypothetical protein
MVKIIHININRILVVIFMVLEKSLCFLNQKKGVRWILLTAPWERAE